MLWSVEIVQPLIKMWITLLRTLLLKHSQPLSHPSHCLDIFVDYTSSTLVVLGVFIILPYSGAIRLLYALYSQICMYVIWSSNNWCAHSSSVYLTSTCSTYIYTYCSTIIYNNINLASFDTSHSFLLCNVMIRVISLHLELFSGNFRLTICTLYNFFSELF